METIFNWIKRGFVFFVLFILGIIFCFSFAGCSKDNTLSVDNENKDSVIINQPVQNGVSLFVAKISKADFVANGINPLAETAYTLTATVSTPLEENKKVDWSIFWKNDGSSWATGKTVTDYVTITPAADGALTATAECLQAFGEQIVVQCVSRVSPAQNATCTIDYAKRVTDFSVTVKENGSPVSVINFNDSQLPYSFEFAYSYGLGTVEDGKTPSCAIVLNSNFISVLTEAIDGAFYSAVSNSPYEPEIDPVQGASYTFNFIENPGDISSENRTDFGFFSAFGFTKISEMGDFMSSTSRYYKGYISNLYNSVKAAIYEYEGNIFDITCSFDGNYSDFNKTISVGKGIVNYSSLSVSSVSLDKLAVIF